MSEFHQLERRAEQLAKDRTRMLLGGCSETAEGRLAFDRSSVQLSELRIQIRNLREASKHTPPPFDDPSGPGNSVRDLYPELNPSVEQRKNSPECKAFERYIRTGERPHREYRDLEAGTSPGPEFIPQLFYPVLTSAQKAWGQLIGVVHKEGTPSGAPQKVALDDDTANSLHESGEPASITETDPTISSTLLNTDILDTGIVKVTIQELQDSAFDIDAFIRNKFGKRYFRGLTAKITNGSTSGNIEKILSANVGATTTTAGGTSIDYDDLVNLYSSLDPAYRANATWVMNSNTAALLLAVKDSLGRPLYVPSPSSDSFDELLGKPVVFNQSAPDVGSGVVGPIQFGDFQQGYLLREVKPAGVDFSNGDMPGLAIIRLNERFMDTLEVGFIGYVRAGGLITDAGTHPIQTLKMAT